MDSNNEILQLGGPHIKKCLWCGIQFYGRNNQKFCSTNHKAHYNSQKRAKQDKALIPWFKEMNISYKALKSCLQLRDKNGWIKTSVLTGKGFDPDVATKRVRDNDHKIYKLLFDIAFVISEDKSHVHFDKID